MEISVFGRQSVKIHIKCWVIDITPNINVILTAYNNTISKLTTVFNCVSKSSWMWERWPLKEHCRWLPNRSHSPSLGCCISLLDKSGAGGRVTQAQSRQIQVSPQPLWLCPRPSLGADSKKLESANIPSRGKHTNNGRPSRGKHTNNGRPSRWKHTNNGRHSRGKHTNNGRHSRLQITTMAVTAGETN